MTLTREDVDIARHLAAFHNGQLDGDDFVVFGGDCVHRRHEVRIFLVDRVHEDESGNFLFKAHFERLFRADGERTGRAGDDYRAVGGFERGDHFALEIEETGHVEDVDFDIAADGVSERHTDGYLALYFFVVIVHRGGAVVDFAEAVNGFGFEKHRFGERSFAFSGVSDESDVADEIGCKSLHGIPLIDFS